MPNILIFTPTYNQIKLFSLVRGFSVTVSNSVTNILEEHSVAGLLGTVRLTI